MNAAPAIWSVVAFSACRLEVIAERQTLEAARAAAEATGGTVVLRAPPPRPAEQRQSRRRHYAHDDF